MLTGAMFVYRSRFLTRGEVWFDEAPDGSRVDWIYHRQRSAPLASCRCRSFYTVLISLRHPPGEVLGRMEEKTSRRIAEAQEKDKLRCERCDLANTGLLDEVEGMWNDFADAHKTPRLERDWVDELRKAGALDLVAAKDPQGNVLAYHLVLLRPKRARQLIAISPYKEPSVNWRNAVSRANCLIHWHNFLRFKEQGLEDFDFGGWYPGETDIRLLGINRFKLSFGGSIVREYDCDQPVTLKGRVLLKAAQWLGRLRQGRCSTGADSENKHHGIQPEEHKVSPAFR
jgi:hypothetical protein